MAQAIAEVMAQDVAAVTADAALVEAARTMDDRNIGDVVVVENGGVVGIVTDRDITVRGTARRRPDVDPSARGDERERGDARPRQHG